ncbi:MAG: class I SAM-dependent methyltransferase [Acidimicrobiia bacterium]
MEWDGEQYQQRFGELAATGADVHGEASFVMARDPRSVLDAGCGTGRVAIELARRGAEVVGVDADESMLSTARRLAPQLVWVQADVGGLMLDRKFDVVVMAGNVALFTPPGSQTALVAGCARHLDSDGVLVCGFQLDREYTLDAYDADCLAAGLGLLERWATWNREPFQPGGPYAVSVHRAAPGG